MRTLTFALLASALAFAGGNEPAMLPGRNTDLDKEVLAGLDAARKVYDSRDDKERCKAVDAFATINDPAADSFLLTIAVRDSHPGVRLHAIKALLKREHPKAVGLATRLAT